MPSSTTPAATADASRSNSGCSLRIVCNCAAVTIALLVAAVSLGEQLPPFLTSTLEHLGQRQISSQAPASATGVRTVELAPVQVQGSSRNLSLSFSGETVPLRCVATRADGSCYGAFVDGFGRRRLAYGAVCAAQDLSCEWLGRRVFNPSVPLSTSSTLAEVQAASRPPSTDAAAPTTGGGVSGVGGPAVGQLTSTGIKDAAVREARRYARDAVKAWAEGRRGSRAADDDGAAASSSPLAQQLSDLFPSAVDRTLPFFPFYTYARALAGDRLRVERDGSFAFTPSPTAPSGDTDAATARLLHSLRREGATALTDKFVRELESNYRLNLTTVPVPQFHDMEALFDATAGWALPKPADDDPGAALQVGTSAEPLTLDPDTRPPLPFAAANDTRTNVTFDYLAFPRGWDVMRGDWPAAASRGDVRGPSNTVRGAELRSGAADKAGGLSAWTRYAQMVITRSQQLPWTRDGAGDGDYNTSSSSSSDKPPWRRLRCNETRMFVGGLLGYGLGADIRMAAVSLGQAIIAKRILVLHPRWRRWAGDPRTKPESQCAWSGWMCYFLPPSPCNPWLTGAMKGPAVDGKTPILSGPMATRRVVIVAGHRTKDIRMVSAPNLLPPGVTREDVEAATGHKYTDWANRQLVRYLMRGLQPWAELMVLQELRRAGYPWDAEAAAESAATRSEAPTTTSSQPEASAPVVQPVVATHYRNGDSLYNQEVRQTLHCAQLDTSLTVAMLEEAVWRVQAAATVSASSPTQRHPPQQLPSCRLRHFFSFDHFRAFSHAEEWFAASARTSGPDQLDDVPSPPCTMVGRGMRADVPVLNTSQNVGGRRGEDARNLMKQTFGEGYLMRVSLGNLFLAASADAWVNNDASNWARMINTLRFTGGSRRHEALYIDVVGFSAKGGPKAMQPFCNIVGLEAFNADEWVRARDALAVNISAGGRH